MGCIFPVVTTAVQNAVPRQQLGTATAAGVMFRQIGGSLAVAAFGALILWVAHVIERVLPATGFDRSVSSFISLAGRDRAAEPAPATAPYAGDVTPALRLWALGDKGLAYDEAATALMARASGPAIIQFQCREGVAVPF